MLSPLASRGESARGFFDAVYAVVALIPEGRVTTYGSIATALGRPRSARVVGWAMRVAAGPNLPCHRVVTRGGALSGPMAFGGPEVQRAMLEAEGVTFRDDGTVDMPRHLWRML